MQMWHLLGGVIGEDKHTNCRNYDPQKTENKTPLGQASTRDARFTGMTDADPPKEYREWS